MDQAATTNTGQANGSAVDKTSSSAAYDLACRYNNLFQYNSAVTNAYGLFNKSNAKRDVANDNESLKDDDVNLNEDENNDDEDEEANSLIDHINNENLMDEQDIDDDNGLDLQQNEANLEQENGEASKTANSIQLIQKQQSQSRKPTNSYESVSDSAASIASSAVSSPINHNNDESETIIHNNANASSLLGDIDADKKETCDIELKTNVNGDAIELNLNKTRTRSSSRSSSIDGDANNNNNNRSRSQSSDVSRTSLKSDSSSISIGIKNSKKHKLNDSNELGMHETFEQEAEDEEELRLAKESLSKLQKVISSNSKKSIQEYFGTNEDDVMKMSSNNKRYEADEEDEEDERDEEENELPEAFVNTNKKFKASQKDDLKLNLSEQDFAKLKEHLIKAVNNAIYTTLENFYNYNYTSSRMIKNTSFASTTIATAAKKTKLDVNENSNKDNTNSNSDTNANKVNSIKQTAFKQVSPASLSINGSAKSSTPSSSISSSPNNAKNSQNFNVSKILDNSRPVKVNSSNYFLAKDINMNKRKFNSTNEPLINEKPNPLVNKNSKPNDVNMCNKNNQMSNIKNEYMSSVSNGSLLTTTTASNSNVSPPTSSLAGASSKSSNNSITSAVNQFYNAAMSHLQQQQTQVNGYNGTSSQPHHHHHHHHPNYSNYTHHLMNTNSSSNNSTSNHQANATSNPAFPFPNSNLLNVAAAAAAANASPLPTIGSLAVPSNSSGNSSSSLSSSSTTSTTSSNTNANGNQIAPIFGQNQHQPSAVAAAAAAAQHHQFLLSAAMNAAAAASGHHINNQNSNLHLHMAAAAANRLFTPYLLHDHHNSSTPSNLPTNSTPTINNSNTNASSDMQPSLPPINPTKHIKTHGNHMKHHFHYHNHHGHHPFKSSTGHVSLFHTPGKRRRTKVTDTRLAPRNAVAAAASLRTSLINSSFSHLINNIKKNRISSSINANSILKNSRISRDHSPSDNNNDDQENFDDMDFKNANNTSHGNNNTTNNDDQESIGSNDFGNNQLATMPNGYPSNGSNYDLNNTSNNDNDLNNNELASNSSNDNYMGYQTSTLSSLHLRKAKLMFFFTRYPSSTILRNFFPDVKFNKANTAQLVKWFSNFREFFYIQMEKYARQHIAEGIQHASDLHVDVDSEIFRTLNSHYNRNNQLEIPPSFCYVIEATLREFFKAIQEQKDLDPSWKKAIYKVIARMDDTLPDFFKSIKWMETLESHI